MFTIRPAGLKILLVSLISLLVLSTAGFLVWQSIREHDIAVEAASRQLLGNARSMAEHAAQSLGEAERALLYICAEIAERGGAARLSEQELHGIMKRKLAGMEQVGSGLVVNAQGRGIANSKEFPLKAMQVADREYFLHHSQNADQGLYLGRPVRSRVLGTWVFTISRRLNKPDGSFAGMAAVSFQVAYFDQFYRSVASRADLQTLLLRTDGWPLAIHPANEQAYQVNIRGKQLLGELIHQKRFGVFHNPKALIDDEDRQVAFARLQKPFENLVAAVSLPRESILADWQRQMVINVAGAVFLMSVSIVLTLLLLRRLRDLERSEAEVGALNERLTLATEAAGIGVWDWDVGSDRLHWNAQMYQLYGVRPEETELGYRIWQSSLHPEDRERAEEAIRGALHDRTPFDIEFRILRRDTGELRHIKGIAKVYRSPADEPLRMVGINYDITARKQSEIEYHTLLNATMDGFWANDLQGRILDVNDAYCALTGYSREELLTMTIPQLEAQEKPEETKAHIAKIITEGCDRFETRHRHKNGTVLDVEISTNYLPVADGRLVVFVRDISDRKRAEQALSLALEAAETANSAKSRFLANVSHEIRTPLNAIVGMTHLLAQSGMSERQREQLGTVESASRTLLAIINDLLDISRIESGKMELELLEFSLSRLLAEQLAMVSGKAEEKGLALSSQVAAEIPDQLLGDPLRLGQILTNLLSNAVKFTEEGSVLLELSLVGRQGKDLQICFRVRDTGIGIPPERLADIFTPFIQSDNSIARRYGGTGLGLAISSQLVRLMGGEICVESKEGAGSVFSFELPLTSLVDAPAAGLAEAVDRTAEEGPAFRTDQPAAASRWSAVEEAQFKMLMKELERQLRRQNMGALNLFRRLKVLLRGRNLEEVPEMELLLDRLDFSEAGKCLRRLAEKFGISYGDRP